MDFGILRMKDGDVFSESQHLERAYLLVNGKAKLSYDDKEVIIERANCFDYDPANCLNFGKDMPEEAGRFDISVMVNADNCEATRSEIEEWKQARRRLWICQISVYLGVCAERELTPEEVAA